MSARDRRRLAAYADFAAFLRDARSQLSLRTIAGLSGVDHSTVSRLAAGNREPTLRTARAIIEALLP